MSKTHLFCTDQHAHYNHDNKRAEYLGHLTNSIRPDTVIFGGDIADMPSLSSYDKGRKSFHGRTYSADVTASCDFLERYFSIVKRAKRKMPRFVFLEGNHEHRIKRAIDIQSELEGTISLKDLQLEHYFNDVVEYDGSTPGIIEIDGVNYAHFFTSGVMGRPIGGEHPAHSLLTKQYSSCTAGHIHTIDFASRTKANGGRIHGLLGGCFIDYFAEWAGEANRLWWPGVVVKRNVEAGDYNPQFISLEALKKEYG